jgi:flagellin
MALTLGGNNTSYKSIRYLNDAKSKMDKSMLRISSGKRILSGADDPGGLSVSMKLQTQIHSTNAAKDRIENAKSYVEMQDSALSTASDILSEMSSLENSYRNSTSDSLKASYASQFKELQVQLNSLKSEQLNGVSLFSNSAQDNMTIHTSASGSGATVSLGFLDIAGAVSVSSTENLAAASTVSSAVSISDISESELESAVDGISALRAQAGGKLSVLEFAGEYLGNMSTTLESAHGRIMDVDIAEETANFAKYSMQYEAAAAAVAQANIAMGAVMDLLLGSINRDR